MCTHGFGSGLVMGTPGLVSGLVMGTHGLVSGLVVGTVYLATRNVLYKNDDDHYLVTTSTQKIYVKKQNAN